MANTECPRCKCDKFWKVRRGKLKCYKCKYEWTPNQLPLRLSPAQWNLILRDFILGLSSNEISKKSGLDKKRVLRALQIVREVMGNDLPEDFPGEVEIDYEKLEGQWGFKRKTKKAMRRKFHEKKIQLVLGIFGRDVGVWANTIPNLGKKRILSQIRKRVKKGSTIYSDFLKLGSPWIDAKDYKHLDLSSRKSSNHETAERTIKEFWRFLKRNLSMKGGGIRRDRLPSYIAELAWRFNNSRFSPEDQSGFLSKRLYDYRKSVAKIAPSTKKTAS